MATLAQGISGGLPGRLVGLGAVIGIVVIVGDRYQVAHRSAWRPPVLKGSAGYVSP